MGLLTFHNTAEPPKPVTLPKLKFLETAPVKPTPVEPTPRHVPGSHDVVQPYARVQLAYDAHRHRLPGETLAAAQLRLCAGKVPRVEMGGTHDTDYTAAIYDIDFKGYGAVGQKRERNAEKRKEKAAQARKPKDEPILTAEQAQAAIAKRKAEKAASSAKASAAAKKRYAKPAERKKLSDAAKRRCADPKERARMKKIGDDRRRKAAQAEVRA